MRNHIAIISIPLAFLWVILTGQYNLLSLILGYAIGWGILTMVNGETLKVHPARLPSQLWALLIYIIQLAIDIFLSSVDVARRVLTLEKEPKINPGIIAVKTQDRSNNPLITALSAHAISITPGELVIDFQEGEETIMYVHTLDVERSRWTVEAAQARRLKLIRRILGYESEEG